MARIHVTLKLSHVRRGLIAEQQHQVEIKQLLFAISNKIRSGFGIQETLDTAISEIKKILLCESLLIVQGISEENNIDCKVMAASLPFTIEAEHIIGRIFSGINTGDLRLTIMKSCQQKRPCILNLPFITAMDIWHQIRCRVI